MRSTALRLPAVQKANEILGAKRARGLKLAVALAIEEPAMRIQNGEGGDALLQRNLVLGGDIEVLIELADVDVHHLICGLEKRRQAGMAQGEIQDVTVVTPVGAKDEEDAFMILAGAGEGTGNGSAGRDICWEDIPGQ